MRVLGAIVRLQVQPASLKVGEAVAPRQRYDPAPLCPVASLTLTNDGVQGWTASDELVPDVHNRTHPATKQRHGTNGISVGFTAHYAAMRAEFGEHLGDGIAGENILVATDEHISAEVVAGGLLIETAAGAQIRLESVIVAAPCVEFARFALRLPEDARPDQRVTNAVRFLHDGLRGYYARYHGPAARICPGDRVLLP